MANEIERNDNLCLYVSWHFVLQSGIRDGQSVSVRDREEGGRTESAGQCRYKIRQLSGPKTVSTGRASSRLTLYRW